MPETRTERVVEHEPVRRNGRIVDEARVVEVERTVATSTEARSAETGSGYGYRSAFALALAVIAMAAIWYYFFA